MYPEWQYGEEYSFYSAGEGDAPQDDAMNEIVNSMKGVGMKLRLRTDDDMRGTIHYWPERPEGGAVSMRTNKEIENPDRKNLATHGLLLVRLIYSGFFEVKDI